MPAVVRLVRAGNVGVSFAGTIVGGLVAAGATAAAATSFWWPVLLAAASTALVTAGGNVLNDLRDVESDRINHPDRPLVRGELSLAAARVLVGGLFVAGILVVVPILWSSPTLGAILVVAVVALLGYEFRFKARGFVGNLAVALLTALVFLYGGAAAGNAELLLPFAAMAFFATLSREIIKDMEDVGGDIGRRTLPRTRGMGFATGSARVSAGIAIVASFTPFAWFLSLGSVAGIMYLILVVAADAIFVASVAELPRRLHWEQTVSKLAMTVALFGFLAVAFR